MLKKFYWRISKPTVKKCSERWRKMAMKVRKELTPFASHRKGPLHWSTYYLCSTFEIESCRAFFWTLLWRAPYTLGRLRCWSGALWFLSFPPIQLYEELCNDCQLLTVWLSCWYSDIRILPYALVNYKQQTEINITIHRVIWTKSEIFLVLILTPNFLCIRICRETVHKSDYLPEVV